LAWHACVLQPWLLDVEPSSQPRHCLPPKAWLTHVRVEVCEPVPHFLEHEPQAFQAGRPSPSCE